MSDYPTGSDRAINRVAALILIAVILIVTITAAITWEIAA